MRGGYRLTPRARAGLLRIVLRAEQSFGAEVAEGVISELERTFELVPEHPRVGHRREDLTPDPRVLFWSVGPTLIAYRRQLGWIEILFVERGEVDWKKLLGRSEPT